MSKANMETSSSIRILKRVVPATELLLLGTNGGHSRVAFREPLGDNVVFHKFDANIVPLLGHHLEIWVVEVKDAANGQPSTEGPEEGRTIPQREGEGE